jgi:probable HAF family extracellular repeat protein
MKRAHHRTVVTVLAVLATVATSATASAAVVVTDLGTIAGDTFSQATSVRDDGVAVGYSSLAGRGTRGVLWDASGVITPLETPGRNSEAYDINSAGVVVGSAEPAGIENPFPVWWDAATGAVTELPGGFSGSARGVNDAGVIVGAAEFAAYQPMRWENATSTPTPLATLPGGANDTVAQDINNDGLIVGFSRGSDGHRHAVLWDAAGAISQLGTPAGYLDCFPSTINDTGMIVGRCGAADATVPVRWDLSGAAIVLPTLGPPDAEAVGVSDAGLIVGSAVDVDGRNLPVRWGAYGTITKLATLGGPHGVAYDINNNGTIVGRTSPDSTPATFHATSWRNAG